MPTDITETSRSAARPLAVVTGASSGIGRELAIRCAEQGFDLVIAADEAALEEVADLLRGLHARVDSCRVDLATADGVATLDATIGGRDVDALLANAGHGLGHGFLDQDFDAIRHVVDTNITGTLDLLHRVGGRMRARRAGRILVTGSIAGLMPGSFQAVYNASKAFVDSLCYALRNELKDTGVTVTCLMPGATATGFFVRASMTDTMVGTADKADPADVAKAGFEAMMKGESDVVVGWKNKLQAVIANLTPAEVLAERHRQMAEPGSAKR